MKQIILIIYLMLAVFNIQSQTCIGLVPETKNLAVMQHITIKKLGFYAKGRAGDIVYPGFYADELVASLGLSYKFKYATILMGSSYNYLYNIKNNAPNIDLGKMYKYSLDFGVISPIGESERFYIWNYNDLLNWYSEIGMGFKFSFNKKDSK